MNHRFETKDGDFTVFISETHLKLNDGKKITYITLPAVEAVLEREPFTGEIYFEDGQKLTYLTVKSEIFLHFRGDTWSFRRKERDISTSTGNSPEIKSPMPGKISKLFAEIGKQFQKGETILILEAMKMENAIKAPFACSVRQILHLEGEIVPQDEAIVIIERIELEKT
jgi:acetyl/propionyl-CoA carboxylase alpha subunit